ncbi:MAG TPA: ABC transporter substrate-binding protein [Candidatus Cybelea sp.]|nr:ABC transporter substrate-binding protein [Candidatus Cybelea sp.]
MFIRAYLAALGVAMAVSSSAAAQDIVIGLSAPITGPAATAAVWERWGVDIALDEINGAGGLLGRKVEIMSLDNRCNPAEAVNVANKLVEAKVAAVIGAHCSSATLAAMPIIKDAKIPMITGVSTSPKITELSGVGGNDWMFRFNPSDQDMMDALGIYLGKHTNFKKIAVIAEDTDFGRGGVDAFIPAAKKNGLSLISTDFYPQNQPDFTSILTRVQQSRPDAIALFQLGGDQINFLRNAMQLGIKIPYTGRAELGGKNVQFIEAGGMEGSIGAWFYSADIDTPQNKAFVAATQKRFNSIPYLQTWHGYDSVKILAQAIKEAGSAEPAKIQAALKKVSYLDVMGETMRFDDHNQAGKTVVIQQVKDRKITVVELLELK